MGCVWVGAMTVAVLRREIFLFPVWNAFLAVWHLVELVVFQRTKVCGCLAEYGAKGLFQNKWHFSCAAFCRGCLLTAGAIRLP